MDTDIVNTQKLETQFLKSLTLGIGHLREAGQFLVKLLDADPAKRETLIRDHKIAPTLLDKLEAIGRGRGELDIIVGGGKLSRLSPGEQTRIVEGPVDALVMKSGGTEILKVDLRKAPREMVDQLVNGSHIRSVEEQRAYLAARANLEMARKDAEDCEPVSWRVLGGAIAVTRATMLKPADLKLMLKALGR